MLGDKPLSGQARELLAREKGLREDEQLKARALERAQAAVPGERTSSIGLRRANLAVAKHPRRWLRTLPLIAASLALVSLAIAGVGAYVSTPSSNDTVPSERMPLPAAPQVQRLASAPSLPAPTAPEAAASSPGAIERVAAPRAEAAPASLPEGPRSLNIKQYATELALLEPARSSIGRGDYAAALTAINQHRREFPSSQLSEEREALRIRALWGLGQQSAALSAAKSFRKHYPRSSLLSWLQEPSAPAP